MEAKWKIIEVRLMIQDSSLEGLHVWLTTTDKP